MRTAPQGVFDAGISNDNCIGWGKSSPYPHDQDGQTQRLAFLGELRWKLGTFMGHDQTWPRFDFLCPFACQTEEQGHFTEVYFYYYPGVFCQPFFLHTLVLYYGCNSRFHFLRLLVYVSWLILFGIRNVCGWRKQIQRSKCYSATIISCPVQVVLSSGLSGRLCVEASYIPNVYIPLSNHHPRDHCGRLVLITEQTHCRPSLS